jgi:hypothetical protein
MRRQLREVLEKLDMLIGRYFTKIIHFTKISFGVEARSAILLAELNLTSYWGFKRGKEVRW